MLHRKAVPQRVKPVQLMPLQKVKAVQIQAVLLMQVPKPELQREILVQ